MDPFLAGLIIAAGVGIGAAAGGPVGAAAGAAASGALVGVLSADAAATQADREQRRFQSAQEKARVESVKAEVGLAQQRTNTALVGAQTRKPADAPSFASTSVLGGLPSLNKNTNTGSSAGTF